MPLDARLRDALHRSSSAVAPDVRRNLTTVRRRTRVVVIRARIVNTVVAATLVGAAVFIGPRVFEIIRTQRETPATNPPSTMVAPPGQLMGSYRVDLSGAGGSLARANLDGPWTLVFQSDGSIVWSSPPGSGVSESLPRDTYQAAGSTMVTNLFARNLCGGFGVGTYSWTHAGGTLTFVAVRDDCTLRRSVLTAAPWIAR